MFAATVIRWGALATGIAAVVLTWGAVATTLRHSQPLESAGSTRPTSIVWNARVFSDRSSLQRWLRSHGSDYHVWAARHGALARIIDASTAPPLKPAAPRATSPASASRSHSHRSLRDLWIAILAAAGAAAIALVRTVRRRPLRPVAQRFALPRRFALQNVTSGEFRAVMRDNAVPLAIGAALVVGAGVLIGTSS